MTTRNTQAGASQVETSDKGSLWSWRLPAFRLARFLPLLFWRGLWIGYSIRFTPPEKRAVKRADWQMISCRKFCRALGVKIRVVDPDGILEDRSAVQLAVCNHLGVLDGWMLSSTMHLSVTAKADMATWPIMGTIGRNVGFIFVERARRMDTTRLVEDVRRRMHEGVRVLVFPEGTTADGINLLPFKTGAFEAVAGMEDGAVLPLRLVLASVDGREPTEAELRAVAWPGGSPKEHARRALSLPRPVMEVRVGTPIPTAGRNRKWLADAAREAIEELG